MEHIFLNCISKITTSTNWLKQEREVICSKIMAKFKSRETTVKTLFRHSAMSLISISRERGFLSPHSLEIGYSLHII